MKVDKDCIIITAYKDVATLRQLLALLHEDFTCIVHLDSKYKNDFASVENEFRDVKFFSIYKVQWGTMEHLNAVLYCLKESLYENWKYVHLISGEDYPTRNNEEIYKFFSATNKIYMNWDLDSDGRRYKYYWPYVKFSHNYKNSWVRYANLLLVGIQYILPIFKKNSIGEFEEIYNGFLWGSYPHDVIDYVFNYVESHNKFMKDLEWCKIPEEYFFQTILMNSEYRSRVENNNLRYWNMTKGAWGPNYLQASDAYKAKKSKNMFARKVKYNDEFVVIFSKMKNDKVDEVKK